MLSTETRLRLENICQRIENHEEVTLDEMVWASKWAGSNRVAARMLNQARRIASSGKPEAGSLDELMNDLDLGDPDPANHLIGPQNPVDLANWFMRNDGDDWRQHD